MTRQNLTLNEALHTTVRERSRRDFIKALLALAGTALLPTWKLTAKAQAPLAVPPTLMLHTKDRWKLINIAAWLKSNGYVNLNYRQLAAVIRGESTLPDKPVIITIDDIGTQYIQPYFLAMIDILEKAGFSGTFGVITRAKPSETPSIYQTLREIAARGWAMETHTIHHHDMPLIKTMAELRAEIVDSAKMIADGIGQAPISLIVPYGNVYLRGGAFDQRIFDVAAEADLDFVVGIKDGRFIRGSIPYYVGRVGVGIDATQTAWWLTHFNIEKP